MDITQHINQIISGLNDLQNDLMELNTKLETVQNEIYHQTNKNDKFLIGLESLIKARRDETL